jgi:hypothetical protein
VGTAVLLAAVVFGLLSRRDPAPPPLSPSPDAVQSPCTTPGVTAAVTAEEPLAARILADGERVFTGRLHRGETKTWVGDDALTIRLSRGGAAMVSVDCSSLGIPGTAGQPWEETFTGPATGTAPTGETGPPNNGTAGGTGAGGASSTPA